MRGRRARPSDHGDYRYAQKNRCNCEPCRATVRNYQKRRDYDAHRGNPRRLPAAPVREHLQGFLDEGASVGQIAAATKGKVTRQQVMRLLYGNTLKPEGEREVEWLLRKAHDALMALTYADVLSQPSFVSAVGVHRRVRALAARGYSKHDIGAAMGISGSAVFNWFERDLVTTELHARFAKVYDGMCMGEGANERMRWRAIREGWAPPLAWTEETIDDPAAEPDRSVMVCAVSRCSKPVARERALCRRHHETVTARNGYANASRFREVVRRLSKTQIHDVDTFRQELAELKSLGVTDPEAAARRLGRGVEYVKKNWNKVA